MRCDIWRALPLGENTSRTFDPPSTVATMERMKRLSIYLFLAACSGAPQSATPSEPTPTQTVIGAEGPANAPPKSIGCPNIQIKAPDSVAAGQQARVTITTTDGSAATYTWTLSAGTIASGQGTPQITVDTSGLAGNSVTATVELGGLASECETRAASATMLVGPA
jgi:hypothetical protein